MQFKVNRNLTIFSMLLTILVVFGHYQLPPKKLQLYPQATTMAQTYSFVDEETGHSASLIADDHYEWLCNFKPTHDYGCGWEIYWDPHFVDGIDFSAYDAVELALDYNGPASRIRVYLRHYNPAYAFPNDSPSTKFMSMTFPIIEADGPVLVNFSEFSVAAWWLQEKNVRREWSLPELTNITKIGVDFIEPGEHKGRVKEIFLVGKWIRNETLFLIILIFWMSAFLIDGVVRSYQLFKKAQHERHLIKSLEDKQRGLEEEKRNLRELADTDPLTGVYNRTGLETRLMNMFSSTGAAANLGIMLLDIDHFKQVNDTHGHDIGDEVLKTFSTTIANNLRNDDLFARWGGEEFVIVSQQKSPKTLYNFAEKLREVAERCKFNNHTTLRLTVSIGITFALKGDSFDDALKRADHALYRAKHSGRNRVEYE